MVTTIVLARIAPARAGTAWANTLTPALAMRITGTCLLALIASGTLLLALRPGYLEQRWLWAKLLLTMVIAPAVWWQATPATLALVSGLTLLAALVAVWRPRLGAPTSS